MFFIKSQVEKTSFFTYITDMTYTNIFRKFRLFIALAATLFIAAGCGNSSDGGAEQHEPQEPAVVPGPAVTGVNLSLAADYVDPWEGEVVIEQGRSEIFYAEVSANGFPEQDKTWKKIFWSISPDAAEGAFIEQVEMAGGVSGVRLTVTDSAESGGVFYVRAASDFDESKYGEAKITVGIPVVTGLKILERSAPAAVGRSITFSPLFTGTGKVDSLPLVWAITERLSFTNSADEEKGYVAAAGTRMEGNTLFVDQQEKYGILLLTASIEGTNYSASVQVRISALPRPPR